MAKFAELQTGQHGRVVLVAQVAADLTGGGLAVDHGQELGSAEQHGENEKNSQHRNASLSLFCRMLLWAVWVAPPLLCEAIIAWKMLVVHCFF